MTSWIVDHIEGIAAAVSAVITLVALFATWLNARRSELRRDDVLAWANEAISALQRIRLICAVRPSVRFDDERARLADLVVETSVLVERGRLFFRNIRSGRFGRDKPHAYRGKRPDILDQLVLAHQVACSWGGADAEARIAMALVAEDAVRRFVSLVQMEVGRVRTASAGTARRGKGSDLQQRIAALDPDRVAAARHN